MEIQSSTEKSPEVQTYHLLGLTEIQVTGLLGIPFASTFGSRPGNKTSFHEIEDGERMVLAVEYLDHISVAVNNIRERRRGFRIYPTESMVANIITRSGLKVLRGTVADISAQSVAIILDPECGLQAGDELQLCIKVSNRRVTLAGKVNRVGAQKARYVVGMVGPMTTSWHFLKEYVEREMVLAVLGLVSGIRLGSYDAILTDQCIVCARKLCEAA